VDGQLHAGAGDAVGRGGGVDENIRNDRGGFYDIVETAFFMVAMANGST